MTTKKYDNVFNESQMKLIFPQSVTDIFFDALLGDSSEGAYDIGLAFDRGYEDRITFQFRLSKRPGKCLRCSLTYGLPEVFSRHPAINVREIVRKIGGLLDGKGIDHWELGKTREIDDGLHIIPLIVYLKPLDSGIA
jgi:hypothetical protein